MWRQLPAAPDSERIAGEGITLSLALDLTGELATRVFFDAALASHPPACACVATRRVHAPCSTPPLNFPASLRADGIVSRSWHFMRMRVACAVGCWVVAAALATHCLL